MILSVRDAGACGDGAHVDTIPIQYCIDRCAAKGGGEVLLEDGVFVSGTLYLKSGVTLHIASGTRLLASPNIADYGTNTHRNRYVNEQDMDRCFLYAEDAENVTIRGDGEIDGNAEAFPNPGDIYRPMMMRFLRCRNVRVEGLRLRNSAAWTAAFLDGVGAWCRGLDILNDKRYNGDGLDFDGTRDVFVSDCRIQGTDDNLCLQSSSRDFPVRNIHIENCKFTSLCAGIRIGLKSIGEIADVAIQNCTFENVWREGVKIECTEGGVIRNIVCGNCIMRNVSRPFFVLLNNRLSEIGSSIGLTAMPEIGRMGDIDFHDIVIFDEPEEMSRTHLRFQDDVMGSPQFHGIRVDAEANHKIEGLSFRSIVYRSVGGVKTSDLPKEEYPPVLDLRKTPGAPCSENYWPDWSRAACMDIRNVRGLLMESVRLSLHFPDERPLCLIEGCEPAKTEPAFGAPVVAERD